MFFILQQPRFSKSKQKNNFSSCYSWNAIEMKFLRVLTIIIVSVKLSGFDVYYYLSEVKIFYIFKSSRKIHIKQVDYLHKLNPILYNYICIYNLFTKTKSPKKSFLFWNKKIENVSLNNSLVHLLLNTNQISKEIIEWNHVCNILVTFLLLGPTPLVINNYEMYGK